MSVEKSCLAHLEPMQGYFEQHPFNGGINFFRIGKRERTYEKKRDEDKPVSRELRRLNQVIDQAHEGKIDKETG